MLALVYDNLSSGFEEVPTTLICVLSFLVGLAYSQFRKENKQVVLVQDATKHFTDIPEPPKWPVIGHMHLLKDYQHDHWLGLDSFRAKYGDIVKLKFGMLNMVMVSSYDLFREILIEKGDIFCNRPDFFRLSLVFGDRAHSLALCDYNNVHKSRRKLCKRGIIPAKFSFRNQLLEATITKFSKLFVKDVATRIKLNDTNGELHHFVTKVDILNLTGDIFLHFLANETRSHTDESYQKFNYGADYLFWDVQQSYLVDFFPFLTKLGANYFHLKRLDKVSEALRDYVETHVFGPRFERMAKRIKDEPELLENGSTIINSNNEIDFVDSMILEHHLNNSAMGLEDFRMAFSDLFGGHAAVANILMRALGHLALDDKIQNKVYEEAKRVNIDTLDHIPALPIAQAVVQESLRMASSPIVPHIPTQDSSIGGYHIPKGTIILFNNFYINRAEKYWEKPLEWNPMRFIEPDTGKLSLPNYFVPFSVGHRQCLGYKLVEDVTTAAISFICRSFAMKPDDEKLANDLLKPVGQLGLNPDVSCFHLKFYPRN